MTDIFKIGFEADVKQIKQVDSALDGMAVAADNADEKLDGLNDELTRNAKITPKVTTASKKATGAVKQGAKAFKLQKGAMQQAGYQVQDFSVQMAGGTKFLTAFGQQASQLAGVLGPGGAVIGAIIAVGSAIGGVLLATLTGAEKKAEEFNVTIEDTVENLEKLERVQMFGNLANLKTILSNSSKDLDKLNTDLIAKIGEGLEGSEREILKYLKDGSYEGVISALDEAMSKTRIGSTRRALEEFKREVESSGTLESELFSNADDVNLAMSEIVAKKKEIQEAEEARERILMRQDELGKNTVKSLDEQARFIKEMGESQKNNEKFNQFTGQDGAFLQAIGKANADKAKLQKIADDNQLKADQLKNKRLLDSQNNLFIKQYESLVFSNLSQEEQLKESLKIKQASLEQFASTQVDFDEQKQEMERVLYADHLAKMRALEDESMNEQSNNLANSLEALDTVFSIFGNLQSARDAGRKAELESDLRNSEKFTAAQIANKTKEAKGMFEAQQRADKASIASSTSVAMMTQAAQGNWLGVAAAFALGAKQYASASAQSYNSPSSPGGGGATPPPSQNTTNNSGGNTTNINFSGATGDSVETVIQYIKDQGILFDQDSAQAQVLRS